MPEQAVNDEQAEIKKRAIQRLVVATTLVAAAVVTLTVLNHDKAEAPPPVSATPAPVVESPAPVEQEPAPEPETVTETPPEAEKPAEPAAEQPAPEAAPATPPAPPPPQVINKPESAGTRLRAEISATYPMTKPVADAPRPQKAPPSASLPQAAPVQPGAATEPKPKPVAAPTIAPVATPQQPAKPVVAPVTAPTPPARPVADLAAPKGYVVQLGLFTNPDNALQLQKRLAEHGIKSYTETRLHVGPFQNKAEADQAQAKIRSMGINAVLAPVR